MAQCKDNRTLHLDENILFIQNIEEEKPYAVSEIMTQISLNKGLKEWGTKSHNTAHYDMKKLYFRDTFKPMHWKELEYTRRRSIKEYYMFPNQTRDGKIKGKTVVGGNKQI